MQWDPRDALPAIEVRSKLAGEDKAAWKPKRDLLSSGADAAEFVVETEEDGTSFLRFGDDTHGRRPEKDTEFFATYRVGEGPQGNVGAETLAHVVSIEPEIIRVRNPLPARGGLEPESMEEARQKAPSAFRTQERAVTRDDYAEAALRHPGLQRAAARFRWTGSWRTVFVTLDPLGGDTVDRVPALKTAIRDHLERFRLAGYDLEVDDPQYISLEIELQVCVTPGYFRGDVERVLLEVFSNCLRPDGTPGLFHPDRFSFGEPVYLSPLTQAALAVEGVDSVQFLTFRRRGQPDQGKALKDGRILLNRLEIARLDNDPNFPEHGTFRATLVGGL